VKINGKMRLIENFWSPERQFCLYDNKLLMATQGLPFLMAVIIAPD
jgi:hypothetical protein